MKEKILLILKPKVAAYGFSQVSIQSVANQIAETLTEEATDEEINAKIEAVIPFFKISQSEVTRIVNSKKEKENEGEQGVVEAIVEEEVEKPTDNFDKMVKMFETLTERIDKLASREVAQTRKQKYSESIKDLPEVLRKSMERKFDRISFKDNEDFETFIQEEASEIPELLKAHSEEKLADTGRPRTGGKAPGKEASDKEIDKIINNLNI